ncbi:translocase of outer mitochondrial membrane [Rhodotorula toruloides]
MAAQPQFAAPFPPTVPVAVDPTYSSSLPGFLAPVGNLLDRLDAARDRLNLPDPGKHEDLGREVKLTHLTNYTFDGARADLAKTLSQVPAFQVTHSFAAGAQGGPMGGINPGTYNFGAVYATPKTFMQGMVDNEGSVTGRFNYGWSPKNTTKMSVQLAASAAAPSMFSLEHDRVGKDYTLSVKAYNPSPADLTGSYIAAYLQSITPHFAVGVETLYQRPTPDMEDCSLGYMAKWHNVKKDEAGNQLKDSWIATAQVMSQGIWQATYWKKLADRVDAGVDLVCIPAMNPRERKAVATAGVKYDFRTATFRGQVDSTGKVSALLEQRLSPAFALLLAGEMDHVKQTSKVAAPGRLPTFNWRSGPYAGQKCHEVQVVKNADDANLLLDSWTAECGSAFDFPRDTTLSEGILGLSDGYGVLLIQVPSLDRIPEKLREMMENPALQKVAIGANWHIREMLLDFNHFKIQPTNVLCLRRLACLAYPMLDERDLNNMVLDGWVQHMGKEVLGVRHSVYGPASGYRTGLQPEKLLVNRTWFVHCADVAVRQRLRTRIAKKAGKLSEMAAWMEAAWTEEEAFEYAQQYCSLRCAGDMPNWAQ